MPRPKTATKPVKRNKHTFYTDESPDVEDMIQQAREEGRVISFLSVSALRDWFARNGFKPRATKT